MFGSQPWASSRFGAGAFGSGPFGSGFPDGAILHFDANLDPYSEQTGGAHKFNHAVLSPQYQLNADGSYSNVGAKPAVDVFGGKKWLRSCGAVTNLLPSGAEGFVTNWVYSFCSLSSGKVVSSSSTNQQYISAPYFSFTSGTSYTQSIRIKYAGVRYIQLTFGGSAFGTTQCANFDLISGTVSFSAGCTASIIAIGDSFVCSMTATATATVATIGFAIAMIPAADSARLPVNFIGDGVIGFIPSNPMLTATAYPVPYVPPGVTQPASNATTTNGSWFSLPDGSELWKALDGQADGVELVTNGGFDGATGWDIGQGAVADGVLNLATTGGSPYAYQYNKVTIGQRYKVTFTLLSLSAGSVRPWAGVGGTFRTTPGTYTEVVTATDTKVGLNASSGTICSIDNISIQRIQPQPLTLATRVRMGVGSGDLGNNLDTLILSEKAGGGLLFYATKTQPEARVVYTSDGVAYPSISGTPWQRYEIYNLCVQVNTAGTHFRVGYRNITLGRTSITWGPWIVFDGSFNPSTLYRLMLGYNNAYPMWFSKITAWKKQVTDAEILEAMA